MTAGNALTKNASCLPCAVSGSRNRKWLFISFCLSILLHGSLWITYRHFASRSAPHVFILLNSGDQAMEMRVGGVMEARPSSSRSESGVQEKRFTPEPFHRTEKNKEVHIPENEIKDELFLVERVPDTAHLPFDREGLFNKPVPRRRHVELPVVSGEVPSSASVASVVGSGGALAFAGVRQRAKPLGAGFTLIYPETARQSGATGTVIIEALIDEDGSCRSAKIVEASEHPELNQAALDAILNASYSPALEDELPVASKEIFEIVFELSD